MRVCQHVKVGVCGKCANPFPTTVLERKDYAPVKSVRKYQSITQDEMRALIEAGFRVHSKTMRVLL